jgi:hypothetical protein
VYRRTLLLFVLLAAFVSAPAAQGSGPRSASSGGQFPLEAFFPVYAAPTSCPQGYSIDCFSFVDEAPVFGLGYVTDRHIVAINWANPACVMVNVTPAVLTVAGKGTLDASISVGNPCNGLPVAFTITGGTGQFAGASGSGLFTPMFDGNAGSLEDDILEGFWYQDEWNGTLTLPNYVPDYTPPVMKGAHALLIRVAKGVRQIPVRFSVTAHDAVDGRVPVTCVPRSRSVFKLGRTRVTCTASDKSANTTTRHFTITVKRA